MKVRVKFSKYGPVKFIGHLDVMRYFQKAIRRAEIDVAYSEGFSPHQKLSFAAPLSVGHTSSGEYFDLELCSLNSTEELKTALQSAMVEGIDILDVRLLDDDEGNAMASVEAASYYVTIRDGIELPDGFMEKLLAFYEQDNIPVVKETKRGHKEINLKESIYELSVVSCALGKADEEAKERIYMKLNASSGGNIKPGFVLESFCNSISYELPPFGYTVHRIETYREREGVFVPLLWEKS